MISLVTNNFISWTVITESRYSSPTVYVASNNKPICYRRAMIDFSGPQ